MFDRFKTFMSQPYSDDMSALDWFWFFGLLIAISVAWTLILRSFKEVAT